MIEWIIVVMVWNWIWDWHIIRYIWQLYMCHVWEETNVYLYISVGRAGRYAS